MAIQGLLIGRLLGAGVLTTAQINAARIAAGIVAAPEGAAEAAVEGVEEPEGPGHQAITVPVSSTAIRSIGWDPNGAIIVEFMQRGTYTYDGDFPLFLAFVTASSKGKFFNEHFQGRAK